MVRNFHAAGIEVILDVVFNHTAEGDQRGPTLSFRGIDNSVYYMIDPNTGGYLNYTGCGNTLNCNHPGTVLLTRRSSQRRILPSRAKAGFSSMITVMKRDHVRQ